jgi:hypothetical protein
VINGTVIQTATNGVYQDKMRERERGRCRGAKGKRGRMKARGIKVTIEDIHLLKRPCTSLPVLLVLSQTINIIFILFFPFFYF